MGWIVTEETGWPNPHIIKVLANFAGYSDAERFAKRSAVQIYDEAERLKPGPLRDEDKKCIDIYEPAFLYGTGSVRIGPIYGHGGPWPHLKK